MGQRIQLKTWRCGLYYLGNGIEWEFSWIGSQPGEQQFVVWHVADHGLPLNCHGSLGQLEDCFSIYEIGMEKIASCDG